MTFSCFNFEKRKKSRSVIFFNSSINFLLLKFGISRVDATIDLSLNAYQNSRNFFIDKKAAGEKARKTAGSAGIAIKNAQIKAKETLDKVILLFLLISCRKFLKKNIGDSGRIFIWKNSIFDQIK